MKTCDILYFPKNKLEFITLEASDIEDAREKALKHKEVLHKEYEYKIRLSGTCTHLGFVVNRVVYNRYKSKVKLHRTYDKLPSGYYETYEEADKEFKKSCNIAENRFIEIRKELTKLQSKLGFDIDYSIEGDTYGIHEEGMYINLNQDGIDFTFSLD